MDETRANSENIIDVHHKLSTQPSRETQLAQMTTDVVISCRNLKTNTRDTCAQYYKIYIYIYVYFIIIFFYQCG